MSGKGIILANPVAVRLVERRIGPLKQSASTLLERQTGAVASLSGASHPGTPMSARWKEAVACRV